jgi:hypothetical protein
VALVRRSNGLSALAIYDVSRARASIPTFPAALAIFVWLRARSCGGTASQRDLLGLCGKRTSEVAQHLTEQVPHYVSAP